MTNVLNPEEARGILDAKGQLHKTSPVGNMLISGISTLIVVSGNETYYYPPLPEDPKHDISKLEGYGLPALKTLLQKISKVRENHEGLGRIDIYSNQVFVET